MKRMIDTEIEQLRSLTGREKHEKSKEFLVKVKKTIEDESAKETICSVLGFCSHLFFDVLLGEMNPETRTEYNDFNNEEDYSEFYSDYIEMLCDLYIKKYGYDVFTSSVKQVNLIISIIGIYSMSWKYEKIPELARAILNNTSLDINAQKSAALDYILGKTIYFSIGDEERERFEKMRAEIPRNKPMADLPGD